MAAHQVSATADIDVKRTVPWIIFVIFFAVLNETVFNVSTPAIAHQFNLSATGVSWVMTTFIIFFGVGSVIYGKLSDILSLKSLIVFGIALYSIGSALGFALQFFYPAVIAARAIQGAGASAIPALITVLVARHIPADERGRVFGVITSTVAVAIGIGPAIGGFVSGVLHWSLLFAIPLFTLIAIPFFRKILPNEQRRSGKIDVPGAVFIAGGVGSLMLYLTFGEWYYLVAALLLLAAFVADVLIAKDPFIDLGLLRNRLFRRKVYVGFLLFSIVIGSLFVIPLMLSSLRGLTTGQIGLVLFPGALFSAALGTVGGNLADRRGNTFIVTIGLSLLLASYLVLSLILSSSVILIAASLVLMYVGFNFSQTALFNSVSQTLDEHETGVGMGLFNLTSFVSGAIGTSVIGRYLEGGWLNFVHNPFVADERALPYSNLMLVLALIVIVSWAIYMGSRKAAAAIHSVGPDAAERVRTEV